MFHNLIFNVQAKIINKVGFIEQTGGRGKRARRCPLHTCGSSCIAIARKSCTKAKDLDGPLGSITKTSLTFFNPFYPFINFMVHRFLALLLIIDDYILSIERRIEKIFPRSACLFNGVDKIVRLVEALPNQLDNLALMIHRFPMLGWVVFRLISWMNFLLSFLIHSGLKNAREKEIAVDEAASSLDLANEQKKRVQFGKPYSYADAAKSHLQFEENTTAKAEHPTEVIHLSVKRLHSWKTRIKALEEPLSAGDSPMYSSYQSANSSPVSDSLQDENHPFHTLGCSYKEIFERENKQGEERAEEEEVEESREQVLCSN